MSSPTVPGPIAKIAKLMLDEYGQKGTVEFTRRSVLELDKSGWQETSVRKYVVDGTALGVFTLLRPARTGRNGSQAVFTTNEILELETANDKLAEKTEPLQKQEVVKSTKKVNTALATLTAAHAIGDMDTTTKVPVIVMDIVDGKDFLLPTYRSAAGLETQVEDMNLKYLIKAIMAQVEHTAAGVHRCEAAIKRIDSDVSADAARLRTLREQHNTLLTWKQSVTGINGDLDFAKLVDRFKPMLDRMQDRLKGLIDQTIIDQVPKIVVACLNEDIDAKVKDLMNREVLSLSSELTKAIGGDVTESVQKEVARVMNQATPTTVPIAVFVKVMAEAFQMGFDSGRTR
jgi:hypothetical protein